MAISNVNYTNNSIVFTCDTGSCLTVPLGTTITGIDRVSGATPGIGTVDTYRINVSTGNNTCFTVHNGLAVCMTDIVDNNNGTYTWNFNEGSSFTTGDLRGARGASVCSVEKISSLNCVDTYSIKTTDNIGYNFDVCNGKSLCILSMNKNANNSYSLHFSDGNTVTTEPLKGDKGVGISCVYPITSGTEAGGLSIYRTKLTDGSEGGDICVYNGLGISDISRTEGTGALGSLDTYTITMGNNATYDFTVQNGNGVEDIVLSPVQDVPGSDKYSIILSDGSTSYFCVAQGAGITGIEQLCVGVGGAYDKYKVNFSRNCIPFCFNIYHPNDGGRIVNNLCLGSDSTKTYFKSVYDNGYEFNYSLDNGKNGANGIGIANIRCTLNESTPLADIYKLSIELSNSNGICEFLMCEHKAERICDVDYIGEGRYRWGFTNGCIFETNDLRGASVHEVLCYSHSPDLKCDYYCFKDTFGCNLLGSIVVKHGIDAYEYATCGGYLGTEAEFTSSLNAASDIVNYVTTAQNLVQEINVDYDCIEILKNCSIGILNCTCTILSCTQLNAAAANTSSICAQFYATGVGIDANGLKSARGYAMDACSTSSSLCTNFNNFCSSLTTLCSNIECTLLAGCNGIVNLVNTEEVNLANYTTTLCECLTTYVACEIQSLSCGAGTACMWAETPYNVVICNDGINDRYSALHWATVTCNMYSDTCSIQECINIMYDDIITTTDAALLCLQTVNTQYDCINTWYAATLVNKQNAYDSYINTVACANKVDLCTLQVVSCVDSLASTVASVHNYEGLLEDTVTAVNGALSTACNICTVVSSICSSLTTKMCDTTLTKVGTCVIFDNGFNNTISEIDIGEVTYLKCLNDINIDEQALVQGQSLIWDGTSWVPGTVTSGAVSSVAGKTGVVTLGKNDVGLSNVDNTADINKVVASASKLTKF